MPESEKLEQSDAFYKSIQNGVFQAAVENCFSQMELTVDVALNPEDKNSEVVKKKIRIMFVPELVEAGKVEAGKVETINAEDVTMTIANAWQCPNGHNGWIDANENFHCVDPNCICTCEMCYSQ